jgi:isoquinoline 1-oxidoreductase subunit beta
MRNTLILHTGALSRRSFLVTVGGTGVGVAFGTLPDDAFSADALPAADGGYRPNSWVLVSADDTVSIISPASEMGQGVMTSLPLLVAEDMDADWNKVRIVQAPADAKNYGNPGFGGAMLTGGSRATPGYYEKLRLVGAQTRKIILATAASVLNVPVDELSTEPNKVIHKKSGRALTYGEVAKTGKLPDPLPQATKDDLKPAAQWRYIGNATMTRIDVPSKVDGSAKFGIDVQLPNMLYAAVLRAPVQGEKPDSIDDAAAKAVNGITHIVTMPYGVGIIGDTVHATTKAKELLKVKWSTTSKVRSYTSDKLLQEYRSIGRNLTQAGVTVHREGDAAAAIAGAAKVISVDYLADHVYHAPIETMNATALVQGDSVEIWAPTQSPSVTQNVGARIAGTTPDKVKVNTTLLGGGFGRKAEADFIIDAVLLAKAVPGRPVKVIWSREDDVQHGKYRPLAAQHVQVGLDAKGNIVGWRHRVVAQSIYARTLPAVFEKGGGKDAVVTEGLEFKYRVPSHLVEYIRQDNGQDVGFWRSVGHGYNNFGVECVIDEIALAKGVDPMALRLDLLKDHPRAIKVLNTVAKMADWGRKREGRALGLAYSDSFGAHCAQIAEISLDRKSNEIRVHKVWCAVDPGTAIQPLNIEAQIAGGITHGASHALFEQINLVNGEVQETNFGSYRVMRMSEAPEVQVTILPTPENPPVGLGEVGLPPTGPAIANAFAALTGGKRLRHYPFLPDRVKAALAS